MRHLITAVALALCASGAAFTSGVADAAGSIDSRTSVNVSNSVNSSQSTSVQSSTNSSNSSHITSSNDIGGTNMSTSSTVTDTGSTCSAEIDGKRCEISCRSPRVAQCGKSKKSAGPSCVCRK